MHNRDLESIFRNRFNDHKESIDSEDMISRLNLNQSKKRRKLISLWWISILSGLLLVTTMFVFLKKKQAESKDHQAINSIEKQNLSGVSKEETTIDTKKTNKNYALETMENSDKPSKTLIELENKSQNVSILELKRNRIASIEFRPSFIRNNSYNSDIKKSVSSDTLFTIKNENKEVSNRDLFIAEKPRQNPELKEKMTSDVAFSLIQPIGIFAMDINSNEKMSIPIITIDNDHKKEKKDPFQPLLFIRTYAGINLVNRSLSSSFDKYDDLVDLRNQIEKQLEAIQVGFNASKTLSKRFYVSAGIEYSQINEKSIINYTTNNFTVDDQYPVHFQIQSNGDTIINTGTSIVNTPSFHTLTEFNHHKLISIPVNFGIHGEFRHLTWFVDAGLSANLYLGFYGRMQDINEQVVSSSPYLKPKVGVGLRTNIGLSYPLTQKLKIMTSLNFTNYLSSIADNSIMTQKYQLGGIRMGVQYQMK